ncbi:hypothetical protein [Mycolicibacterium bacteremicum]|nr:hypothetical protein [Mycolicibacterium bacteremicum]MCV7434829.1 hypothetical protein [Mycolicibacterium bacteremicum]
MLTLPPGTLFAELQQQWCFQDLAIKGETIIRDRKPSGFWEHSIAWPESDDETGTPFDRLDIMWNDPTASYPIETAPTRHDCREPETRYLVLEAADIDYLISVIRPGEQQ